MAGIADDDPYFTDPHYNEKFRLRRMLDNTEEGDPMASAEEVLEQVDQGGDPALLVLIRKRAEEKGISRLEALRELLP